NGKLIKVLMAIEWMAPPSNDGVHPSHQRILPSSGQAKRVSYTAVQRSSQQLLFPPIEAILYFFKGLQIFWGLPINENQCSLNNFQKDCVLSFLICETSVSYTARFP
ncbi:MAG: hypothetical protein ACI9WL_001479, partial [Rubritalea sp.]